MCEPFLKHLYERIKEEFKNIPEAYIVKWDYEKKQYPHYQIYLYHQSWHRYEMDDENSDSNCRTSVRLISDTKYLTHWGMGVYSPIHGDSMTQSDKKRFGHLVRNLQDRITSFNGSSSYARWPYWIYFDKEKANWNELLPVLRKETEGGGGDITESYVKSFTKFATNAISIIKEVEGPSNQPQNRL